MHVTVAVDIDATAERVWAVMTNVEAWPQWTASVTEVKRLDTGRFGVGSRVRIKQPKLPPVVWTVEELISGRSFTWAAGAPGFRSIGRHTVEGTRTGARATLELEQRGPVGELFGRLVAGTTDHYVRLEAAGLKRRSEESRPESGSS